MGLSARYKRRPIRARLAWWVKYNGKLEYYFIDKYFSTSGKGSYDWKL